MFKVTKVDNLHCVACMYVSVVLVPFSTSALYVGYNIQMVNTTELKLVVHVEGCHSNRLVLNWYLWCHQRSSLMCPNQPATCAMTS